MEIVIHSKDGCPYCDLLREHLSEHGVRFTEIKHNDDDDRNALYDSLGLVGRDRTVPQLIEDGQRLGGWSAVHKSDLIERWQALVGAGTFDEEF